MTASSNDRDRVTDHIAGQLLERAANLDDGRQLADLRAAAIEAGISGAAFDQAVAEWRASALPRQRSDRWVYRVVRNIGAFGAAWASLSALGAADRLLAMPWLVHKLTDPLALLIGAVVAVKLRARTATVVLGGLAVSQLAEFLMDLLAGAPAIQGFYPHIALMVAGIGGVAASQLLRPRGGRGNPATSALDDEGSAAETARRRDADSGGLSQTAAETDMRFIERLRLLRANSLPRLQPGFGQ